MVVIIDYNIGNLKSVQNAFERIGVKTIVSRDHDVISQADGIVLPGVGTFPVAMENLKKYDLYFKRKKGSWCSYFRDLFRNADSF